MIKSWSRPYTRSSTTFRTPSRKNTNRLLSITSWVHPLNKFPKTKSSSSICWQMDKQQIKQWNFSRSWFAMVITLCQHNLLTLQLITISAAIIYPLSESFRRIYSLTASKTSEIRLQLFLSSRLSRKCTITFPTTPTKTCSKNLTQSPTSSRKQKLLNLF